LVLKFTGERIVPGADNCEPTFAQKMYQEHIARYAFAAQFAENADILDVGCGVGYGSQWLGQRGAKSVLGIDLSSEAVEHARKNYFHPAVSYRTQGAGDIDLTDAVDLVTCFELIEHIEEQERVLDLIKNALRSDGILVISTPRPHEEIRTHFHVHEMDFEELYSLLKKNFKFVVPFSESNYFTSFIGSGRPDIIDQIVHVSSKFDLDHADYFLFMATNENPERFAEIKPLITMNDDSYILTLENDVHVLRNAENNHLQRIADLETEKSAMVARNELENIRTELNKVREILAISSQKLAEAETLAFSRSQELINAQEMSHKQLNDIQERLDFAEATLTRFRRSLSWNITRPIRWIGRTFKRFTRRSAR